MTKTTASKASADLAALTGMRDEAVHAKTGKTWSQWLAVLDAAGAAKWPHAEIASWLHEEKGIPGWWCQMVTVGYERARGLRVKHQTARGFEISRSSTIAASASKLFEAWSERRKRERWMDDPDFTIRTSTRPKTLRITWGDGATNLEVALYPKGAGKTQVTLQHSKLASAADAARMKEYWGEQLERLKEFAE